MRRSVACVVGVSMMVAMAVVPGDRAAALPPVAATFHGLNPARLLDTRVGATTIDHVAEGSGTVGPHSITTVLIAGRGGVPAGTTAGAVALNVTAAAPSAVSYLTVWPAGAPQPTASNLNLQVGVTTPNMVIVPLSADGKISIYNDAGNTHLLVDVLGWFPTGNAFTGLNPARLLDTRVGATTIDHVAEGSGTVGPHSITTVTIAGRGGVPAGTTAGAVALNVTAAAPSAVSYVTVWPAGASQPTASNLNLQPNVTTPNMVIVPLSADGKISIYNDAGSTHLLVDVLGWFPTGNAFTGLNPARLLDTRVGATTIDHVAEGSGTVGARSITTVTIAGRGGVPAGTTAGAVALNVTAAAPSAVSYLTVWPAGAAQPTASNLNLQPNVTTPNMVIVPLSADGKVSIYNDAGSTHLLVDVLGWFPATTAASSTTLASVPITGATLDSGAYEPAISADGRFVAFYSNATNLVPGEIGFGSDVFVRDLLSRTTTRVSVASDGTQGIGGGSTDPAISADGRYVAFSSSATNLVAGDTNHRTDVFVHDRVTGATTRVSVATNGSETDDASERPTISADGRLVAFQSDATNLVAGDTNSVTDVFLHDRTTGLTTRVSTASGGAEATGGGLLGSSDPAISADGRLIAFQSNATNLVADDTNLTYDVFVHDVAANTTTRVSVSTSGDEGTAESSVPALSADGRYVTFTSYASNLVPGDTNLQYDVFLRDRTTGTTSRVSVASSGAQATGGASYSPVISADGRYISFYSYATDVVAGDTNASPDVFLHDRATAATTRIDLGPDGQQTGLCDSYVPSISGDGRFVAYYSDCDNLVAGDTNTALDVFVYDQGTS